MKVYVVVTEDYFGGQQRVRVFERQADADTYAIQLEDTHNLAAIVLETPLS